MKTLILLIIPFCATSQIYYGGSAGIGIGKYYNGKTKQIKSGPNDLYLSVPVGYATDKGFLFEVQPQTTLSLNISASILAGYKIDFSDNAGVHLLAGYTVDKYFHPTGTLRLWFGQGMIQGTYFNKQVFVGVGVVGFWEKIY